MNDATPIQTDIVAIRLGDLTLSPLNTRQTVPDEDIADMASTIAVLGLMQNLSVHRDGDMLGVVAGGKRLRGLQLLAKEGRDNFNQDTLVPCRITDDPDIARQWAIGENETRAAPHPADQIRAYRDLAGTGAEPAAIARAFGKTERHVRGRLALANLPDTALTALRAGQINLDEAKALTMASDPAQAERVLESALTVPRRHAGYIRRELAEGRISATDRRVVFVGLDTYRAEGGAMTEDLFEGNALLHDEALLDKLFAKKLALKTEQVEGDEGWSWATAVPESYLPHDRYDRFVRVFPEPGELTEADAEEYDRLAELANADAINDQDADRLATLQSRLDGDFTDAQREKAGVFLYVDGQGKLQIDRAYVSRDADKTDDDIDPDTTDRNETKPKPAITAKGTEDLHIVATLALQTALVTKPDLLLDLLAFQMEADMYAWSAPLNVTIAPQTIAPSTDDGVTTDARLMVETEIEGPTPDRQFAAFQGLGKKHRNSVLSRHLSRAINAPMRSDFGRSLMALAGADMRRVWTPTAANHFSALSVPALDALWSQLLELDASDERAAEFSKLKKGEKAKALEALFSDASVQEAHGLSRDQVKTLDAWVPAEFNAKHQE